MLHDAKPEAPTPVPQSSTEVTPAPEAIVAAGRQAYGRFSTTPARANLLDAPYLGLPRGIRWWRLKEWQAVQISTPELFMNLALFDAKLMSLVQIKVYDKRRGQKHVFERKLPPMRLQVADSLLDSHNGHVGRDVVLAFDNHARAGHLDVLIDLESQGKRPRIHGKLRLLLERGAPHVVSMPLVDGGMYSHKGMFPVTGRLVIGDEAHELSGDRALALLDDHKGYYPYVMRWDWLTSAKVDDSGVAWGFNLTRNQCREPLRYNENCVWRGDRFGTLPAVSFERRNVGRPDEVWLVRDEQGRVDVEFRPTVPGDVRVNALLVESRYRGPFGHVRGRLAAEGLPDLVLDDWFGMGEDFHLRC
ncbi:MAG: DUF2804 family protein [Myxococcales bacterium]|nr:DUF2804 family protein [Myxococcales bacterium]